MKMNIFEENIIAAVSDLYREAVVNELLLPITRKTHSGYRFEIKDKETISGLREYWEQLSEQELGESELSDKKLMRNLWRIFCRAVTVLSYLIEELSADGMPTIQEKYKEIKRYYQDYKKAWKKPIKTFSRKIQEIYNADRIAGLSKTEISEVLDKAASEIQAELPKYSSENQILVVYHYYRHHTAYNEETFKAFCKMLGMNEQQPIKYIAVKTTVDVDAKMESIKDEIYSNDNLENWYNEVYGNANTVAQTYKSLKPLIPKSNIIKKTVDKMYKKVGDREKAKGNKHLQFEEEYIDSIYTETINTLSVPIIGNTSSSSQYTSKYSNRNDKIIKLDTLHRFLNRVMFTFKIKADKLRCPEFIVKEFIILCEDSYNNKIYDKGTKSKDGINYIELFGDDDYIESISKLYIYSFIISAFHILDEKITAPTNKNRSVKSILQLYKMKLNQKECVTSSKYLKILREILKNWG